MLSIKQNVLSSRKAEFSVAVKRSTEPSGKKSDSKVKENGSVKSDESSLFGDEIEGKMRSLAAAERGVQESISKLQSTDAAFVDTEGILRQMRELAGKVFGGNLEDSDRAELQNKLKKLMSQIGGVAGSTEYNSQSLFNGKGITVSADANMISFRSQVTAISIDSRFAFNELANRLRSGDVFTIPVEPVSDKSLGLSDLSISDPESAARAAESLDKALETLKGRRAETGKILEGLSGSMSQMKSISVNLSAAGGSINSVDAAFKVMEETKAELYKNASAMFSAHSGKLSETVLSLLK